MKYVSSQRDVLDDITLRLLTEEAISGNKEALASLIESPNIQDILDKVSSWAAWEYKQDRDDIRQVLLLKLCITISTLSNPNRLHSWFYNTARNLCINAYKHRKVVDSYIEMSKRQYEGSARQGGKPLLLYSAVLTPEQELLQNEQKIILEKIVQKTLSAYQQEILDLWLQGKNPKEIAEAMGRSLKTVYRILKEIQKAIIDEVRITP